MNIELTVAYCVVKEVHPHIAKKLLLFCGSGMFVPYINSIILDSRDGERSGFSNEVASAIFTLAQMHENYYPCAKP